MKETTGLPILGELFEQYVPLDSELTAESKEFRLLFFLVMAFFEYTREDRDKSKCLRWYCKVVPTKSTELSANSSIGMAFTGR